MDKIGQKIYEYYEEINQGIKQYIPENKKILDVGGGFGALAEEFQKKNNIVCNIDSSELAIQESKKRNIESYVADITDSASLPNEISGKKFDVLVFADILEHVHDPFSVLKIYDNFLAENGRVIISVPNIATWTVRTGLLFGNFTYTDTGNLDRTHIRFFTKKSLKKMIRAVGYEIEEFDITPNFIRPLVPLVKKFIKKEKGLKHNPRAIIDSPVYKAYLEYFYPLEKLIARIWPPLFAFQFILILRKKRNGK
jgi:2-polyprenyl-3-methyl-5-hydroxy-6-metoxy-1,4-benzoquinol methylase